MEFIPSFLSLGFLWLLGSKRKPTTDVEHCRARVKRLEALETQAREHTGEIQLARHEQR